MKTRPMVKGDLPQLLTTDLDAVVRSNLKALRRQMTHDHLVAQPFLKVVLNGRKQLGWDTLFKYMTVNPELRREVELELSTVLDSEGWHLQGDERDYPPISLAVLAERAGVSGRRLREMDSTNASPTPTAKQLTLSEAFSIAAAANVSIQQLVTPPWGAIHELDAFYGSRVEYLPAQGSVPLDIWMNWIFGLEALPKQNEFVYERNQSFPPELGDKFDKTGRKIHMNNRPTPAEIEEFNAAFIFGGKKRSWFAFLRKSVFLPSTPPSQEDTKFRDRNLSQQPFVGAYLLNGVLTHLRRLIRASRKPTSLKRLDKQWMLIASNVAFLTGRIARLVAQRAHR